MAKILKYTIHGLIALLLITPMLLSSRFFFPYISSKTFFYRLVVEIIVVLYVILITADKRFRPRLTPLTIAVLVYLAILYATSVFGSNFYRSFWGNAERGEGLLTFTHVIALFIVMTGMMKDMQAWKRFFAVSVVVSFVSAIYATFQKFCPADPVASAHGFAKFCADNIVVGDVSRLSALIGNAAFYAGYLLMNISLAAWLLTQTRAIWKKVFFGIVISYEIIILNYTRTRGALIGLFIGFIVAAILFALMSDRKRVRLGSVIGLGIFVVLAITVYTFRDSPVVLKLGGLNNVTHISADDITTQSRLLTWNASWKGWKDRFFLGYGYENFNVAFNKYFPAQIYRDSGSQIWFDRAHDVFFDVAVSSGVFGIATYLALYGFAFWALYKFWLRDPRVRRTTAILISAGLVAYFVQNLFVFDTLGTYTLFYSMLAFAIFLQLETSKPSKKPETYRITSANPLIAALAIFVMAFVTYTSVIKPAQANIAITQALVYETQGKLPDTLSAYKKVIAMDTYMSEEARQKLAEAVMNFRGKSTSTDQLNSGFRLAIDEMKQAIDLSPKDARDILFLMTLYNNLPTGTQGSAEEVIRLGQRALVLSPTRPQIYFEMGQAAIGLGRVDEGIGYFRQAVAVNPEPAESHWNLALALAFSDHFEEASSEIQSIYDRQRIGKISDASLKNMISIMLRKFQFIPTIPLLKTLVDRNPKDASLEQQLAFSYGNLCQSTDAKEAMARAVELNPELAKDQQAFLDLLSANCK